MSLRTTLGLHSLARKSRAERRSISCSSENAKSISRESKSPGLAGSERLMPPLGLGAFSAWAPARQCLARQLPLQSGAAAPELRPGRGGHPAQPLASGVAGSGAATGVGGGGASATTGAMRRVGGGVGGSADAACRLYTLTSPKKPVKSATTPIPSANAKLVVSSLVNVRSNPTAQAAGSGGHVPTTARRSGSSIIARLPKTIATPAMKKSPVATGFPGWKKRAHAPRATPATRYG